MAKQKRKLSKAEKAEKARRRAEFMTVFVNGKQKRVRRPLLIDGMDPDEFIKQNADEIWLHQNEMWEEIRVKEPLDFERTDVEKIVSHVLSGKGAHAEAESVFEGLDWRLTGIHQDGAEHSIFQLLNHMIYWQEWAIKWLDGEEAAIPERAAGSWPGSLAPANREEWELAVGRFKAGVDELTAQSREGDIFSMRLSVGTEKSRLEMLHTIGSHNSYHLGQVVILRQMLGAWPPPSGGLTW